jgi:nitroimidazol reductase NimA-like FMN-containing flavoprotein (pyridoxamine 5'-phosphate oxidase superfamily)
MPDFAVTERTRLHRCAHKVNYDKDLIYSILDQIPQCTIAICVDGQPRQMVSSHWRVGDDLYIHGGVSSAFYRQLAAGAAVSVSIAATDGLVLERSAYDTSVNFRSVMIYGRFAVVSQRAEQLALLQAFYQHLLPGRWSEIRAPSVSEMAATYVLRLPLVEVVAKLSQGGPQQPASGAEASLWAGVRPYVQAWGAVQADEASASLPLPSSVAHLARTK